MSAKRKSVNEPVMKPAFITHSPLHSLMYAGVKSKDEPMTTPSTPKVVTKEIKVGTKNKPAVAKPALRTEDKIAAELRAAVDALNEVLVRGYDANLRTSIVAESPDPTHPKKMALKITSITVEV